LKNRAEWSILREGKSPSFMKVNDPNLLSLTSAGIARSPDTKRTAVGARPANPSSNSAASTGDVHLSELLRSLRSLAADSPDRQAKLEEIARAYAKGEYEVDAQATASKVIDDALGNRECPNADRSFAQGAGFGVTGRD
jgi:flagellar biosynthesis anti-sigma factor FlgM